MYKILSVGGSIIIPKTGFDITFLKKFRKLILDQTQQGDKFILIVGGGATCRQYQQALHAVSKQNNDVLDWLGIYSTWFNAEFVRMMFGKDAYEKVIKNPKEIIKTKKKIIICGGERPGQSTDAVAVKLAQNFQAKEIFNLSNIEYAFDKDPNKYKNAKKIENISWKDFRKIVGNTWSPGFSAPFDPTASKLAEKLHLRVSIVQGTNLPNLGKALRGQKYKGTVIE
ncbi:MAG: UMP kinase [Candidatus Magasanikbacteria bacterium CG11_big_fil_rev_8_21_14_0_20_39_34]|uniref:UMP kinase n=1 Tax=Candidatus Magasanikbacteria bacterium CG11_big_fil_rev_8_21_14_0_20_39_34 TaxID=1974653 RepID=A0A2H0N4V6_9BACT|nr:MAG: UMP kinase [Candidatus Magasanikbacteria bacterium CG11_big_fil_rev_8_21_14_0_20_39_34]